MFLRARAREREREFERDCDVCHDEVCVRALALVLVAYMSRQELARAVEILLSKADLELVLKEWTEGEGADSHTHTHTYTHIHTHTHTHTHTRYIFMCVHMYI